MKPTRWLARRRARRWVRSAQAARARGDWPAAARAFAVAAGLLPERPDLLVQYGHASKESGDYNAALDAYRAAAAMMPDDSDVRVHLAALLSKCGDRSQAATVYGEILAVFPDHPGALAAVAQLGERERMGLRGLSRRQLGTRLHGMNAIVETLDDAVEEWIVTTSAPTSAYDLFRATYPTPPPPVSSGDADAIVAICARNATAAMLRVTLDSVAAQTRRPRAIAIVEGTQLANHPVASRLIATPTTFVAQPPVSTVPVLTVEAGVVLDPQALAWLDFALRRTGAAAAYGDHDEIVREWPGGDAFSHPTLFGAHDIDVIASTSRPPLAALMSATCWSRLTNHIEEGHWRNVIRHALIANPAVHVPRRLASLHRMDSVARAAPVVAGSHIFGELPSDLPPERNVLEGIHLMSRSHGIRPPVFFTTAEDVDRDASIAVIIPTRENIVLAAKMAQSLFDRAEYPGRVEVVLVDNARNAEQSEALRTATRHLPATIVSFDEPFNWSAANNRAAADVSASLLVFANDDMEMLTDGWDRIVAGHLSRDDVGAVGARLLYPDRSIQHAGILFGIGRHSLSEHEGVGAAEDDFGPDDRWSRTRAVAAVTGAFLAVTRRRFLEVVGFDAALAIAYNDLDFCLRVRERGTRILYVPEIELIHHESLTRGRNLLRDQVAWDRAELNILARRWGEALLFDPSYNPQWALRGVPFDGFREPTLPQILRSLESGLEPWRVMRLDRPQAGEDDRP